MLKDNSSLATELILAKKENERIKLELNQINTLRKVEIENLGKELELRKKAEKDIAAEIERRKETELLLAEAKYKAKKLERENESLKAEVRSLKNEIENLNIKLRDNDRVWNKKLSEFAKYQQYYLHDNFLSVAELEEVKEERKLKAEKEAKRQFTNDRKYNKVMRIEMNEKIAESQKLIRADAKFKFNKYMHEVDTGNYTTFEAGDDNYVNKKGNFDTERVNAEIKINSKEIKEEYGLPKKRIY